MLISGAAHEEGQFSDRQHHQNHVGPPSGGLATIEEMSRETTGGATDDNNNEGSAASDRLRPPHLRLAAIRRAQKRLKPPPFPPPPLDTVSEAGTFQDVSEIRTVHEGPDEVATVSEDTRARADELEGGESSDIMEGVVEEDDVSLGKIERNPKTLIF